jgi:HD-GYP domain-containing protein (c-di-GMP phosphodiesterase class II)
MTLTQEASTPAASDLQLRMSDLISALSLALDLTEGQPMGHAVKSCVLGMRMAEILKLSTETRSDLIRRTALLHDIGKLSVPNKILDKNGKLTAQEWEAMRLHPYYTQRILERISGFKHLAFIASTHHEKLDGSGYYRNLRATQLPLSARSITMADIYDALSAKRPYRDALPTEKVIEIISKEVPHALDESCFEALKAIAQSAESPAGNP